MKLLTNAGRTQLASGRVQITDDPSACACCGAGFGVSCCHVGGGTGVRKDVNDDPDPQSEMRVEYDLSASGNATITSSASGLLATGSGSVSDSDSGTFDTSSTYANICRVRMPMTILGNLNNAVFAKNSNSSGASYELILTPRTWHNVVDDRPANAAAEMVGFGALLDAQYELATAGSNERVTAAARINIDSSIPNSAVLGGNYTTESANTWSVVGRAQNSTDTLLSGTHASPVSQLIEFRRGLAAGFDTTIQIAGNRSFNETVSRGVFGDYTFAGNITYDLRLRFSSIIEGVDECDPDP